MKYLLRVLLLVLISVTNSLYSQAPFERCHIDLTVPPCPANPLQKPGYYVLLDQDFRNPLKYWNIHHPEDAGECKWDFIQNQNNVTFPCSSSEQMDTGYYNFDQVINPPKFNCYADLWNTNVSLNGCAYSKGEISTHTIDYNNNTFMNYYFYGSGYFEAKVKLFAAQGQGSAMWLWGVQDKDDPNITFPNILDNNEIDVFETLPNATDLFDVTYHWRQTPGMEAVEESQTIHLIPYDYTQNWTVFAVEWNENSITWFVNNELVYNIEISEQPKNCPSGNGATHYFPPIAPYCLRFNTGSNTVGDHEQTVQPETLPLKMEIEYVRVYKKEGEKASPIRIISGAKNQICITENSFESSNTVLSANYYPDAIYSWTSPAFEIEPYQFPYHEPHHHNGKVKVWVKPNIQGNQTYPIYLTTYLPNHTEQDTIYYYIANSAPPLPPNFFQATPITGNGCLFEINNPIYNSSTYDCEFYNEETSSWQKVRTIKTINNQRYAYFGYYEHDTYVNIKYREINACGYSDIRNSSLTIPSVPPGSCGW